MLTSAELSDMRAVLTASFPDTATRLTYSSVADGQGGETPTYTAGSSVACRLTSRQLREAVEGEAPRLVTVWQALLPHGTTLDARDRLRIGGVDYEITGLDSGRSEGLCLEAQLRRVS